MAAELAIVVVSKLNACAYCVSHHEPKLQVEGLSSEAVATLPAFDHPEFDEVDRLVIEYSTRVTREPGRIPEAVFQRLRAHFSDAQIVELTLRIALCGASTSTEALQIDNELTGHADGLAAAE
jgi:AhpD family alkylhydroperoxidase